MLKSLMSPTIYAKETEHGIFIVVIVLAWLAMKLTALLNLAMLVLWVGSNILQEMALV